MRRRSRKNTHINEYKLFDKEQYADKELIDTFQLWMLRVYFKGVGITSIFHDRGGFDFNDSIAHFLDLGEYIDFDEDEVNKKDIIKVLKEKYIRLENRKRFSSNKILTNNIKKISKLMYLNNYEEEILKFTILQNEYEILSDVTDDMGNNLNGAQAKKALSIILDIPIKEVEKCFATGSKFSKSSLVIIDNYTHSLDRKFEFLTKSFTSHMLSLDESIEYMLQEIIYKCDEADLTLKDFDYIKTELDVAIPYLKSSIKGKTKGVNILLYGLPGTGKTELTKSIADEINQNLYEISYTDEDDEAIEGKKRLNAYKSAQALLSHKDTILMFDEVEDVFNSGDSFFSNRQTNKAWINRMLENNSIPTIWITNDVHSMDDAVIRRFDMTIEIPIPSKDTRKNILNKYSQSQISSDAIAKLADTDTIAPALISRAAKVVASLDTNNKDKAFEMIIDNTLKAQGYRGIKQEEKKPKADLPKSYNPAFINTDMDLNKLTRGIKKSQNARICLYGPAGTGKSAYGKYLADKLNKPLIIKKGSDLLSMWVGGTEKNIAEAFAEAKDKKAVLVFDEVDSFLADRSTASKNWEITQVNEMLVQMESFDGIFIATTNLMDNLDKASLRRFDLKLEFSFLESEQAWLLLKSEAKQIGIKRVSSIYKKSIDSLRYLTPGDFAAVIRQNRFNPIEDIQDFIMRLEDEAKVKKLDSSKKMGFLL